MIKMLLKAILLALTTKKYDQGYRDGFKAGNESATFVQKLHADKVMGEIEAGTIHLKWHGYYRQRLLEAVLGPIQSKYDENDLKRWSIDNL